MLADVLAAQQMRHLRPVLTLDACVGDFEIGSSVELYSYASAPSSRSAVAS